MSTFSPATTRPDPDQAAALRRWATTGQRQGFVEPQHRAFTLAIASGKGGVGKTTLAVNLSIALRRTGTRVTLVDADLGMANADVMCGLSPRRRLDQALVSPDIAVEDLTIEAPGGFLLVPGCVGFSRLVEPGYSEQATIFQFLRRLESTSDIIVLDTGAGVGSGVTSLLSSADAAVVVATPDPPSIADAYALIKCVLPMIRAQGRPDSAICLLVNQAKDRAEAEAVHARIAGVASRFLRHELRMIGWVPTDTAVSESVRSRVPFLVGAEKCAAGRSVRAIAQEIAAKAGRSQAFPDSGNPGWLGKLLRLNRRNGRGTG